MRPYLILILVFLMPLQVSWATVANYCTHEQESASHHIGHHEDEHQTSVDADGSDKQPAGKSVGVGHDHNHLSGFAALLLSNRTVVDQISSSQLLPRDIKHLPSLPPGRLERPNWYSPA